MQNTFYKYKYRLIQLQTDGPDSTIVRTSKFFPLAVHFFPLAWTCVSGKRAVFSTDEQKSNEDT